MKYFTFLTTFALFVAGCGDNNKETIDIPNGLTLVLFDNETSEQYLYDTETETYETMNGSNQTYDMTNKHGKSIVWNDNGEKKIIMFKDNFDISEGNVTSDDFYYLGHFHTNDNKKVFAAHSSDEFSVENNASAKKLATLTRLSGYLLEQETIKNEINQRLSNETVCNLYAFDDNGSRIVFTNTGKIRVFDVDFNQTQTAFELNGVSKCEEEKSSFIPYDDDGVLLYAPTTGKLYLLDNHGDDFHAHSSWTLTQNLPSGFVPTKVAGIGEPEEHEE